MFLMGLAMGACTEDYKDWAAPQTNAPEAAAEQYAIQFATATAAVDMDKFYDEVEQEAQATDSTVISTVSSSDSQVGAIIVNSVDVNGVAIKANLKEGSKVMVSTLELDSVVREAFFSRAHVERTLDINVNASAQLKSGAAVNVKGGNQMKLTPITIPEVCADGYAVIGDFVGVDWEPAKAAPMEPVADKEGVFKISVETKNEGDNWFKIYKEFDREGGWDAANAGVFGCRVNGDNSTENFAVFTGDVYEVRTPVISGAGHFNIIFDAINMTYSISPATAYLYIAGDVNGWKQVDALASPAFDGKYTGYAFLNQNGFKFCSQQNWDGPNYGADFSTAGDAANITMTEPDGFYKVEVDLNEKTYTLTAISGIEIIGDATAGGWDAGTAMTQAKEETDNGTINYWTITTDLTAGGAFKIRKANSWDLSWGGSAEALTTADGSGNISIAETGNYTINFYPLCEGMSYCTITMN